MMSVEECSVPLYAGRENSNKGGIMGLPVLSGATPDRGVGATLVVVRNLSPFVALSIKWRGGVRGRGKRKEEL